MKRMPGLALALLLAGCSSAAAPGAGSVIGQLDKANMAQVDLALRDARRAEEAHFAQFDTYNADPSVLGLTTPENVIVTVVRANQTTYCAQATHSSMDGIWHVTKETPLVSEGSC